MTHVSAAAAVEDDDRGNDKMRLRAPVARQQIFLTLSPATCRRNTSPCVHDNDVRPRFKD